MKNKFVRGVHAIPTIQGVRNNTVPTSRQQAVNELPRLQHEKARLEQETNMCISKLRKTEKRLQEVEERLAHLLDVLQPQASGGPPAREPRRSPARRTEDREEEGQAWRELSIEY
jgi:septal ring factor EnvC (AmiA/AmiB activator)